jgi:microcystin-dependent protein
MSDPFLCEIKIVSFKYAPLGWAFCDGQLMPVSQNLTLFSLLGATFGGDGQSTFALPDLRGRVPIHAGKNHKFGTAGGEESHTLVPDELPAHAHTFQGTPLDGGLLDPKDNLFGIVSNVYTAPANLTPIEPGTVAKSGSSQPHTNLQPYLVLNFCISLGGTFPTP